jgi:hypothetical protein
VNESFKKATLMSLALAVPLSALTLSACGGGNDEPTKVPVSIAEQGKKAKFTLPKSSQGGLVELEVRNNGKAPHGVQLIRYTGNHDVNDVLKQVQGNTNKTPDWLQGQGGTGGIPPGQSDKATLNLPAGNYVVIDSAAFFGPGGPPAYAQTKFTSGDTGDLPSTPATVKAAETGKDKYAWDISDLKAGNNDITFDSEGKKALHIIIAAPVKGKAPALSQVKKDLATQGPPPPYIDFKNAQGSAVLDGGLSQTTSLNLKKPGQYIFFCPFSDRDGGKSHDQEGLLKVVTVK